MSNIATLTGHLGANPDIRTTNSGRPVANFSVATNTRWTDRATGELQERTEWHRIVVWSPAIIDLLARGLLYKGSQVLVMGEIRTRPYTTNAKDTNGELVLDSKGQPIPYQAYSTEIVLAQGSQLEVMGKRDPLAPPMRPSAQPQMGQGNGTPVNMPSPTDESIPFSTDLSPNETAFAEAAEQQSAHDPSAAVPV